MKLSRLAAWASIIQTVFTALAALIMLLLFVDPASRASQWIPHVDRFYLEIALFLLFGIAIFAGLRRLSAVERAITEAVQILTERLDALDKKTQQGAEPTTPDKIIYKTVEGQEFTYNAVGSLPEAEKRKLKKEHPEAWEAYLREVSARMPSPTPGPTTAIPQAQLFQSQGFSWELTHNFWPVARSFAAEDNYMSTGMIGPLCPHCKVDVSDDLRAHTVACHQCHTALRPAVPIQAENRPGIISSANSDQLWPLKKAAYRDAQAALRRGDITAP